MGRLRELAGLAGAFALVGALALPASAAASPSGAGGASGVAGTRGILDVLAMAERYSPDMKASLEDEKGASEKIRAGESQYYPTLNFTAVDNAGFPGSSGGPPGFNGLMDSPYRVGWATGVYSKLTLFDLTRDYGVRAAKSGLQAARGGTEITRLDLDFTVMNLFMDAILDRSQRDTWQKVRHEIDRVYGVVRKFVRNGQYSEVTQWLLKDHSERARQQQEVFEQGYQAAIRRLEIATGVPEGTLAAAGIAGDDLDLKSGLSALERGLPPESPLIASPRLEAEAAHDVSLEEAARNWPRLLGIASAGAMDDSRLVPSQNYSAWIGLTFPIFEGFRISAETEEARAEASRRDDLLEQARLGLADSETRYAEAAREREIDVARFGTERRYAIRAMNLAEHRLVTFVGDLADVRDALSSYETAESGLSAARVELFRAKFSQLIIEGAGEGAGDGGSARQEPP